MSESSKSTQLQYLHRYLKGKRQILHVALLTVKKDLKG